MRTSSQHLDSLDYVPPPVDSQSRENVLFPVQRNNAECAHEVAPILNFQISSVVERQITSKAYREVITVDLISNDNRHFIFLLSEIVEDEKLVLITNDDIYTPISEICLPHLGVATYNSGDCLRVPASELAYG